MRKIDLTDQVFGSLRVLSEAIDKNYAHTYWNCQCKCGSVTIVRGSSLRDGAIRSCGCARAAEDLTNKVFGRLTVVEKYSKCTPASNTVWTCRCTCGNIINVPDCHLKFKHTTSCGCYRKELKTKHNLSYTAEYTAWASIIQRCENKKSKAFIYYGARGITVCEEWKNSFEAFYRDMGTRPSPQHSIDRKDNNGNYCKENCRWATKLEQANNKRSNVTYLYKGSKQTIAQIARDSGLNYDLLKSKLARGLTVEEIIILQNSKNSTKYDAD